MHGIRSATTVHAAQRAPIHAVVRSLYWPKSKAGLWVGQPISFCVRTSSPWQAMRISVMRPAAYGVPTTMMWAHRLGLEHAKQFLLTGRAIDAATAHRIGLFLTSANQRNWPRISGREAIYTHTCQSACTQDVDQPGVRKHGSAQFADVRTVLMASLAIRKKRLTGAPRWNAKVCAARNATARQD